MVDLKDRRVLVAGGAALALLVGGGAAALLMGRSTKPAAPPPASEGGLVVEMGKSDGGLDPAKPLRCFVQGTFVGVLKLSECAERNGVATGSLDVGLDASGELSAATEGVELTPAPADPAPLVVEPQAPLDIPPAAHATAPVLNPDAPTGRACWRYQNGDWRQLSEDVPVGACVIGAFQGRCARPGEALYARWGDDTLRLLPDRVEVSPNNRDFRPLGPPPTPC